MLAVIPARIGSRGLPRKNIQLLCGKPLIQYTIEAAQRSGIFDKIIVSTDSKQIASLCKCDVIIRPPELARDNTPVSPVIIHALESYSDDVIVTLQPTSPFRESWHIRGAYDRFLGKKADSLLSVKMELHTLWNMKNGIVTPIRNVNVNRQWLDPYYIGNGAIFITKRETLLRGNRLGGKIEIYVMNETDSLDIHLQEDLELAEWMMKRRS